MTIQMTIQTTIFVHDLFTTLMHKIQHNCKEFLYNQISTRTQLLTKLNLGHKMIYEPFDWKSEEKAYKAQLEKDVEDYAFALQEIQRREWAQRHGNDSGFDPYADIDE
jgi:hypothetical protein